MYWPTAAYARSRQEYVDLDSFIGLESLADVSGAGRCLHNGEPNNDQQIIRCNKSIMTILTHRTSLRENMSRREC